METKVIKPRISAFTNIIMTFFILLDIFLLYFFVESGITEFQVNILLALLIIELLLAILFGYFFKKAYYIKIDSSSITNKSLFTKEFAVNFQEISEIILRRGSMSILPRFIVIKNIDGSEKTIQLMFFAPSILNRLYKSTDLKNLFDYLNNNFKTIKLSEDLKEYYNIK